jgi:hypothetical protein
MDGTRYARVQPSVRPFRSVDGTAVPRIPKLRARSVEALFSEQQRLMASAVAEQARPGLFVFAAHTRLGHLGRLWLEASAEPRAGSIGRHDEVDLALPLDDSLSLRHLLFVVQRRDGVVRFAALDLDTPQGVRIESGQQVRLVEAVGVMVLQASEFIFFCVPTGQPLPWRPDAPHPWATLLPRAACRVETQGAPPGRRLAGRLEVDGRPHALSADGLSRGVLLGRAARCDVVLSDDGVSRVHAVLLRFGGAALIIDAGSTNGTWCGETEVAIAPLTDGARFTLGAENEIRWNTEH